MLLATLRMTPKNMQHILKPVKSADLARGKRKTMIDIAMKISNCELKLQGHPEDVATCVSAFMATMAQKHPEVADSFVMALCLFRTQQQMKNLIDYMYDDRDSEEVDKIVDELIENLRRRNE